jgi:hypothetical protein
MRLVLDSYGAAMDGPTPKPGRLHDPHELAPEIG